MSESKINSVIWSSVGPVVNYTSSTEVVIERQETTTVPMFIPSWLLVILIVFFFSKKAHSEIYIDKTADPKNNYSYKIKDTDEWVKAPRPILNNSNMSSFPILKARVIPISTPNHLAPTIHIDWMFDLVLATYPISGVEAEILPSVFYPSDVKGVNDWRLACDTLILEEWKRDGSPHNIYYIGVINSTEAHITGGIASKPDDPNFPCPISVISSGGALGIIVAHELGHNHGLFHAPGCSAGDPDPNYPVLDGTLDIKYGWDYRTGTIIDGSRYKDFMTGCSNVWISAFTFEKIRKWEMGTNR